MISHKNVMFSGMQGFIVGTLNAAVAPVSPSPEIASITFTLTSFTDPQPPRSAGIPVTLVSLPFYHSYGLSAFSFRAFAVPCTAVIMPKWDVNHAVELIPKYVP